jgi:hypothetical protein
LYPGGTCDGWIEVGLSNSQVPLEDPVGAVGCAPLPIPEGISRYPLSVSTQYQSCREPGGFGAGIPPCVGPNASEEPPLPPGTYGLKAEGLLPSMDGPPPVQVVLSPDS